MAELKKLKMDDIEGMIRLADDVLNQMERNANVYDDNGVSVFQTHTEENAFALLREEKHWERAMDLQEQVREVIHEKVSYEMAYYGTMEEQGILDKIAPLRERILGIFRNGAEQNSVTNETEFCADESVPDEYLLKLFAMRIRDRRITGAVLRFPETYYVLVRMNPLFHQYDEVLGVFRCLRTLRKAYEEEQEKLSNPKSLYLPETCLRIYEYEDERYEKTEQHGECVQPKTLWG